MPTQSVNLTPELDRFVKEAVASGRYQSASEVHRAALSAMARAQAERGLRLAKLRQEIQRGLHSGAPEEVVDLDALMDGCFDEAIDAADDRA